MDLSKQNILFFPRTMSLGGTENVVLQLCEIFKPLVNNVVVCSCGGENVRRLNEMNIRHYTIPDIEDKSPSVMIKTAKELLKIVKEEDITVIHTHHRMAAFYVAALRLYKKCNFISTIHGIFLNKKYLTRYAYGHAKLIACGNMVKKNLVGYFALSEERICVIPNAVRAFDGAVQVDETIKRLHENGCVVVGNISRLSEEKGVRYFIESMTNVRAKYPKTHYLIVGTGKEETKLRNLVKELRLEDSIHFLGYRMDVQSILSQIDLAVLSSLTEGLPLAPIEVFSVGKTIVATAVGGMTDLVEDGKNGLLVEPKNPGQIAEKVIWMIEHPEAKRSMEQAAQECYCKTYSIERFRHAYLDFYLQGDRWEEEQA